MKINKTFITIALLTAVSLHTTVCSADVYREFMLVGGYSKMDKLTGKRDHIKNAVGIEWYEKFSDEYGDYMTADVQLRAGYDSDRDSKDAWGFEVHNAWLDFKTGMGEYLRVGHFDPQFGLEPVVDTHSTIFQTLIMHSIGFNKDWGVGYRGLLGNWDYSVAAQTGSGMGLDRRDDSGLLTARIGTPQTDNLRYGFSALYGNVLEPIESWTIPKPHYRSDDAVLKRFLGADIQYDSGPVLFSGECAAGMREDDPAGGAMLQADYRIPDMQKLVMQMQGIYWSDDLNDSDMQQTTVGAGFAYTLTSAMTLRAAYFHDLHAPEHENDRQVILQLYYSGK